MMSVKGSPFYTTDKITGEKVQTVAPSELRRQTSGHTSVSGPGRMPARKWGNSLKFGHGHR